MKKLEELPKTKSEYEIFTKDLSRRSVSNQYMYRSFNSDGTIQSEYRRDKDGNITKVI